MIPINKLSCCGKFGLGYFNLIHVDFGHAVNGQWGKILVTIIWQYGSALTLTLIYFLPPKVETE